MQLPVSCVQIAAGNSVGTRSVGSEAVVHPIRNRAHREWSAREVDICARKLPTIDYASKQAIALEGQVIYAAHAKVVCTAVIGEATIFAIVGRIVCCAATDHIL